MIYVKTLIWRNFSEKKNNSKILQIPQHSVEKQEILSLKKFVKSTII